MYYILDEKTGVKNDEQFYFIYFWLHWVFVTVCRRSLVAASQAFSSCGQPGLLFNAVYNKWDA